jgi:hypothetical protein
MGAASFKSLYQKRPIREHAAAQRCVAGRSRYSTKTCRYKSEFDECIGDHASIESGVTFFKLFGSSSIRIEPAFRN